MLKFDTETALPPSPCCECGYLVEACAGPCAPVSGDFTLCIKCACLNVFGDDLKLRKPTDDEIFATAADPDFQLARRAIIFTNEKRNRKAVKR